MIRIHCTKCPTVTTAFTVMDALRANDAHGDEMHPARTGTHTERESAAEGQGGTQ